MKLPEEAGRPVSPPPLKKRKYESTTTNHAVKSFFTPASKKEPDQVTWSVIHDTLLLGRSQIPSKRNSTLTEDQEKRRKVAAFDLDSTLIATSSGNIYAKDATDWRWWHLSVPSTLRQLHADGFHIVVLTNQGSVTLRPAPKTAKGDQRSLQNFKSKTTTVLNQLGVPVRVLAATARDIYRKPRTGMWTELLEDLDLGGDTDGLDFENSVFVGDAGGRAATGDRKADHACSDRDLAANVGIKFMTPEEFFLKEEPKPFVRPFEPKDFLSEASTSTSSTPILIQKTNDLDIVIMCGSPGCGKSTFYWTKLKPLGYGRVNQDILKSREKCVKMARATLDGKVPVAVDNTNADTDVRAVWIDLAEEYKIPIRCVYFTAPPKLCEHNDTVRALNGEKFNPEKREILPHSAFSSFKARFKEPQLKEGFQDIVRIDFRFEGSEEMKKMWSQYWI